MCLIFPIQEKKEDCRKKICKKKDCRKKVVICSDKSVIFNLPCLQYKG